VVLVCQAKVQLGEDSIIYCRNRCIYDQTKNKVMKKWVVLFMMIGLFLSSCSNQKPYYKTRIGKKKQTYYNKLQFGAEKNPKRDF
jgi:hypothetical protein